MKKIVLLMTVLCAGIASQAEIRVNWQASSGFYFNATPSVGILGSGTGNSTIAYLVYDVDTTIGPIMPGTYNIGDSIGSGGTILDSITLTEDGNAANDGTQFDSYALFGSQNYTGAFTAGNVYAAIFQDNNIELNDWYYYTTPIALSDATGIDFPQTIEMNTDLSIGDPIDFGSNVAQVVPEPATFLLFGMGGFGAWLIRRNKMKSKEEA